MHTLLIIKYVNMLLIVKYVGYKLMCSDQNVMTDKLQAVMLTNLKGLLHTKMKMLALYHFILTSV